MITNPTEIRDRLLLEVNKALDNHEMNTSTLVQRNTILEERSIQLEHQLTKLARMVDNMECIEDRPDTTPMWNVLTAVHNVRRANP